MPQDIPPMPSNVCRSNRRGRSNRRSRLLRRVAAPLLLLILALSFAALRLFAPRRSSFPEPRIAASTVPLQIADRDASWEALEADFKAALADARTEAEAHAEEELRAWSRELAQRAEARFLPWYLSYLTQQSLGLRALWQRVLHRFAPDAAEPSEAVQHRVRRELEARVLSPPLAQRRLQRIAHRTVAIYCEGVRTAVSSLPARYRVPRGQWEVFTAELALVVDSVETVRSIPLSLKLATPPALVAARALRRLLGRWCGYSALRGATTPLLGPAGWLVILAWDVADHALSRRRLQPVAAEALAAYFEEMRMILQEEISGVLQEMEREVLATLPEGGG